MGQRTNSAVMEVVTSTPSLLLLPSLTLLSLSLSVCESISGFLKTCQMCSDQCNGLRVHYIHSAPFYEVTSWRGLPAGALCCTVNQAWQRWGGGGWVQGEDGEEMDGWRGMEVGPSPSLCLISQEEMHHSRGRKKTHTCTQTHTIQYLIVKEEVCTCVYGGTWHEKPWTTRLGKEKKDSWVGIYRPIKWLISNYPLVGDWGAVWSY